MSISFPNTHEPYVFITTNNAKSILAHSVKALFFCSNANITPSGFPKFNPSLALYQKAKICTMLSNGDSKGTKLNPSLVRGIFEKLRDSKRFPPSPRGIKSGWLNERYICSLLPEDYTTRFHLVENMLEEAGKFLESIPENLIAKKTLDRAEAASKKMRKLGILLKPSPYSSTTSLYSFDGNRGKVDEILREMKENNVKLDSLTVNVFRVYAAESDVRSMEKLLPGCEAITMLQVRTALDMPKDYLRVERSERASEVKDHESYKKIMRLYSEAGKSEDVYRIWNHIVILSEFEIEKLDSEEFRALFQSLLNIDDSKEQERCTTKSTSGRIDVRVPTMLVSGFHKIGMVKQADILMKNTWEKIGNQLKPSHLRNFIKSLSDSYKFSKALEAFSGLCEKEVFFERSIPYKMKGYATLLNTYMRCSQNVYKTEAIFEKMGELGFLPNFAYLSRCIDVRVPTMLVSGFHKKGMVKQADILMKNTWEKIGNQLKPSHLRNFIKSLSDSYKFSKALEAFSGLCEKEVFFERSIPYKMKGYATLLNTYMRCSQNVYKTEAIFEKMGELGFLPNFAYLSRCVIDIKTANLITTLKIDINLKNHLN
ncbi:LOW QUALITY PROTEIN: hypothetical protein HID58_074773 [Brassica napus]|uniref:Pentatricopeptide repeat-containing protein n=1 Tax=Brassica napus TaxID=3708 RepID=A0ABQ7YHX8_BRANA|nr:LOW QUALITY PROTEIN: hypothetical protein HID58_074773 [Brassica napus]